MHGGYRVLSFSVTQLGAALLSDEGVPHDSTGTRKIDGDLFKQ